MQHLVIKYCDPTNHTDSVTLSYKLRNNSVTDKWVERVKLAQSMYNIDNPGRFYGFGSATEQAKFAIDQINTTIDVINKHIPIVSRSLKSVTDQDTLNYLHNIFERYHGLLDQQDTDYWNNAPSEVQRALADLNILVHRCESVARGAQPRHVVTWYGLPKTEQLALEDYSLFESNITFGTVYLTYVEIGKTLEDLSIDNDQYIGDDAFRPYKYYSADFNIKFFSTTARQTEEHCAKIKQYYDNNSEFFIDRGLPWGHPYLASGAIPLADLDEDPEIINKLATRQWVKSVKFI